MCFIQLRKAIYIVTEGHVLCTVWEVREPERHSAQRAKAMEMSRASLNRHCRGERPKEVPIELKAPRKYDQSMTTLPNR